jgi:hypothetical protein
MYSILYFRVVCLHIWTGQEINKISNDHDRRIQFNALCLICHNITLLLIRSLMLGQKRKSMTKLI